jgi:hypothetical protein
LNLSLAAWLRQQGFARIETATAVAVDWLGQAGFSEDVVVHGEELDQFLGAPATAKIAAMSDMLRHELDRQMNELLRPPHSIAIATCATRSQTAPIPTSRRAGARCAFGRAAARMRSSKGLLRTARSPTSPMFRPSVALVHPAGGSGSDPGPSKERGASDHPCSISKFSARPRDLEGVTLLSFLSMAYQWSLYDEDLAFLCS